MSVEPVAVENAQVFNSENGEPILTAEQLAAREARAEEKRRARMRDTVEVSLGNLCRRRMGHEAEGKAIQSATRDALIVGADFFTWDELAERIGLSRAMVGKILQGRSDTDAGDAGERLKRHKGDPGGKVRKRAAKKGTTPRGATSPQKRQNGARAADTKPKPVKASAAKSGANAGLVADVADL